MIFPAESATRWRPVHSGQSGVQVKVRDCCREKGCFRSFFNEVHGNAFPMLLPKIGGPQE